MNWSTKQRLLREAEKRGRELSDVAAICATCGQSFVLTVHQAKMRAAAAADDIASILPECTSCRREREDGLPF